jgi:hypothetical protein
MFVVIRRRRVSVDLTVPAMLGGIAVAGTVALAALIRSLLRSEPR